MGTPRGESFQASVMEKHGRGRIRPDERDTLRSSLCRAFGNDGGINDAVNEEVDRFIQNGHVSSRNLSRLERLVQRRVQDTSNDDADTLYSRFSQGALSARSARQQSGSVRSTQQQPGNLQVMSMTHTNDNSWSEIAKHSKRVEEQEKMLKLDAFRSAQQKMRVELDQQVAEKEIRKRQLRNEEQQLFHQQKIEYESWQASQEAHKEELRRKALEVKKEREVQAENIQLRRDMERERKLEEDRRTMKRALREQEQEKKINHNKKMTQKESMAQLVKEWEEGKKTKDEEKKYRAEEERKKLKEMDEMMKLQDARKMMTAPRIMHPPPAPPIKHVRRGEELYNPDRLMEQMRQSSIKAEEAERQMIEEKRVDGIKNRDFLFKQIAERDIKRKDRQDQKIVEKEELQEDASAFLDLEKHRIAEQRTKNVQYRIELEKQIAEKQATPRYNKDCMSLAEKAINRNLIQEVRELRTHINMAGVAA